MSGAYGEAGGVFRGQKYPQERRLAGHERHGEFPRLHGLGQIRRRQLAPGKAMVGDTLQPCEELSILRRTETGTPGPEGLQDVEAGQGGGHGARQLRVVADPQLRQAVEFRELRRQRPAQVVVVSATVRPGA